MILDICYNDGRSPEQIQKIRVTFVRISPVTGFQDMTVRFYDGSVRHFAMIRIAELKVSND